MITELISPTDEPRATRVIAGLNKHNEDLTPEHRQSKYEKIEESAFIFYRGTNHLFWEDLAGDARLQRFGSFRTRTWLQGDLHVENFGAFGNDENVVVYDINDFDESVIADYQYDVWRMAVSIALVARDQGDLSREQQENIIDAFSRTYLETVADYCENGGEHDTVFDRSNTFGRLDNLLKKVKKKSSREDMLADWTAEGKFLTTEKPDKLAGVQDALRDEIIAGMEQYSKDTLAKSPDGADDNYFEVRDVARRLSAGTGSLGTPRFYVLIKGADNKLETDRILDLKRQSRPIPYQHLPDDDLREYRFFTNEIPGQDAIWHAAAYRAMATDTDDHLGWMKLPDGFYSVRERSFYKESIDLEDLDSEKRFSDLAKQWGAVLATDHSRALTDFDDDFPQIDLSQVLFRPESDKKAFKCQVTKRTTGKLDEFSLIVREVAFGYADQVVSDWKSFKEALKHTQG